jgi:CheY-like chemotaxis protein
MTFKLLAAGKKASYFQPIKESFDQEDAIVISANSIALALFLARKNQPDLIISQLQLVDGDGLTFFYETRNEPEIAKIPFAFLCTEKEKNTDIFKQIVKDELASKQNQLFLQEDDLAILKENNWKEQILSLVR